MEGLEAVRNPQWWHSLLDKERTIDEWVFQSPRPVGTIRPSTAAKSSVDRQGEGNPCVRSALKSMDVEQIRSDFKLLIAWFVENEFITIKDAMKAFSSKWPKAGLVLSEYPEDAIWTKFRSAIGKLGITDHDLEMRRGKKISVGIRNSPHAMTMAAKMGQLQSSSPHRVTVPQRVLNEMLKVVSPNVKMEFDRDDNKSNSFYSFDFYCPVLNAVIEMHGRVWHDVNTKSYPGLKRYVDVNIPNDIKKKAFAQKLGYTHHVFWDDQQETWEEGIRKLYGKPTIGIKEAKNIVRSQPWPPKSL